MQHVGATVSSAALSHPLEPAERASYSIYRHSLVVRVTHWTIALCVTILLMSGLQIFNAHPALYWGSRSDFDRPFLAMVAEKNGEQVVGLTKVDGRSFDTTGVLGASKSGSGELEPRGFPAWITLPSYQDLALGRRWHFFFAWLLVAAGLVYLVYGLVGGHIRRDLLPSRNQLRHTGRSILEHLRLRFPKGREARHYNVLQKLSYLFVVAVLLPVMVLSGLTMSPGFDAAFPALLTLFDGRQSARTIHFVAAFLLVGFAGVHILMVLISGVVNNIRSMITGRYVIDGEEAADAK
jgi:thiosulfate reductase cytochrome b subunit